MSTPTILLEARSAESTGAWVDLSPWLLLSGPLTISRGREREDATATASMCTLTLDNLGGEFTEGRTSTIGGTALKWGRWAQLRVSINGQLRFTGWVTDPGLSWPKLTEGSATATVTASGVKAALAVSPNLKSWITELYEDLSPVAWWPLDDPAGSASGAPKVGADQFTISVLRVDSDGDPVSFGASAPEWFDGAGSALSLRPKFTLDEDTGTFATASIAFMRIDFPAIPRPCTLLWVHQPDLSADYYGDSVPILSLLGAASESIELRRFGANLRLRYSDGGGPIVATGIAGTLTDGVPRLMGISLSGSSVRLLGTTAQLTTPSPVFAPISLVGAPPPYYIQDFMGIHPFASIASGLYAHVAFIPGAMSDATFADLRRRIEGGLGTDLEWVQWACAYAGTAAPVKLGPTRPIMRPNLRGSNPAAIGDQMADAYGGMLTDGRDGTPTLVDPRYVPTQASIPVISLDDVVGAALRWQSDPTLRVTEAGQGESVLASRSSWPRSRTEIDQAVPVVNAQARARWLVNASDVAEAPRLTGIEIDMLAMPSTSAIEPLAYLHRPRVRIAGPLPSQLPVSLRTMTVEGTTETVSVTEWTLALSTAPDPRFILADPVQGVLGVPADNRLGF